jgi:hypothetical protein
MIHLRSVADQIKNNNRTLQGMCIVYSIENRIGFSPFFTAVHKRELLEAERQLRVAGMLLSGRYYKKGAIIIKWAFKEGIHLLPRHFLLLSEVADELLEKNVFAHRFDSGMIVFQSTAMARFCEQESAYWREYNQ